MASVSRTSVQDFGKAPVDWEDCNICYDIKDEGLKGHTAGKAEHKYHQSCLNEWLAKSSTCPDCREPLSSREVKIRNPEQAMIQLELNFPGILNAPKEYLHAALKQLKISAPLSAGLVLVNAFVTGNMPLELSHVVSGGLIGYLASHVIRNVTHEAPLAHEHENDITRMQLIMKSRPFLGAMIGSAAVGAAISSGTFLVSSVPFIIAGIGARYGLEKLHEGDYISEENKDKVQIAATVASSALSLMSPIKAVASLVVGSFIGATIEAHKASSEVVNQE